MQRTNFERRAKVKMEVKVHQWKFASRSLWKLFRRHNLFHSELFVRFDPLDWESFTNSNFFCSGSFESWALRIISSTSIHDKFETENWDFNFHFCTRKKVCAGESLSEVYLQLFLADNLFSRGWKWKFVFCTNFSDELLRPFVKDFSRRSK